MTGPRPRPTRSPFAAALRKWRRSGDITQRALAHRLHVSEGLMAAMETGARRPAPDVLVKLAALGFVAVAGPVAKTRPKRIMKRAAEIDDDTPLGAW